MASDHYFTPQPRAASRPARISLKLPDVSLQLLTDHGVFAYAQLDRGTETLLRTIPTPPNGDLLDLGCGYGAVSLVLAKRCSECTVWAVDVNERALALTEENARNAGVDNIRVLLPDEVPASVRFSAIYSNPPIRVGKQRLHEVLTTWLDRLLADGRAFLVAQRNLGADSLAGWLAQRGHLVERIRSRSGYRVLEVRPLTADRHHAHADA